MIYTLTIVYNSETPEKSALDVMREIYDYANKGLKSISVEIEQKG
jgi:hypothetical protein